MSTLADGLIGCEALEGLQAPAEIVGADEVGQVVSKLVVSFVAEALDGHVFQRAVHAFDLAVGPRVAWFGQAVVDVVLGACIFESMREKWLALLHETPDLGRCRGGVPGRGEVRAVIGQHGMDCVRQGLGVQRQQVVLPLTREDCTTDPWDQTSSRRRSWRLQR